MTLQQNCARPITLIFDVAFYNYFTEMIIILRRRVARNIWVATLFLLVFRPHCNFNSMSMKTTDIIIFYIYAEVGDHFMDKQLFCVLLVKLYNYYLYEFHTFVVLVYCRINGRNY